MNLGEKVKALRTEKGYSVRELAQLIGKSPGYVSRIEVRGEIPAAELLCVIAEVFGVEPEELFQLAKECRLRSVEEEIDEKHSSALSLFRKKKNG